MLTLPVHVEGAKDVIDSVLKLKKLENTWNDRDPKPQSSLFLVSVKNPVQRAIWDRINKAVERKMKAANALADAAMEAENAALDTQKLDMQKTAA